MPPDDLPTRGEMTRCLQRRLAIATFLRREGFALLLACLSEHGGSEQDLEVPTGWRRVPTHGAVRSR